MREKNLDMDAPADVARRVVNYATVMTDMCDGTDSAMADIHVSSGDSPTDDIGTQSLSWTTSSISGYARSILSSVDAATRGVAVGADDMGTTDTDYGVHIARQV